MAPKPGDYGWIALAVGVAAFDIASSDQLTHAANRYCAAHPWLTRAIIAAVAGHLAGLLPPAIDVLSAKNRIHIGIVVLCTLTKGEVACLLKASNSASKTPGPAPSG
jgi:hypothetical protein